MLITIPVMNILFAIVSFGLFSVFVWVLLRMWEIPVGKWLKTTWLTVFVVVMYFTLSGGIGTPKFKLDVPPTKVIEREAGEIKSTKPPSAADRDLVEENRALIEENAISSE